MMAHEQKRIALYTGAYNHIADGVSLTLNRLVAFLLEGRADVLVLAPTTSKPALEHQGELEPVPSVAIPGRAEYRVALGLSRQNRERLRAFSPDIMHIATPDLAGTQARAWAHRRGLPIVASYHTHFSSYLDYYRMGWMQPLMWAWLRSSYRSCSHIYVPTPSMADILRSHGIHDGVELWPRGVETDIFHPDRRSVAFRQRHGFSDDDVVVAFISRLVIEKGTDVYAGVIQAVQAEGVPVRALVVGAGPAEDNLRSMLPQATFTGHLSGDALAEAYASSDIFLFPSETETFGNVTLEAMASGLPTVCANAVGSKSLVRDGETGILCRARDTADFTQAVCELIRDTPRRAAMGRAARERSTQYSWPVILGRLNDCYDRLLKEKN
ncbi:MAG: glycosyl transferase family 1 [Bacteroidetes bacterium CG12_big_fil_rev_8_21_14_0_65_60_17]|nr:MAG: glycosyl transferase family 1 [Bacteroidetes bacterium CG12_big_fil_rev_8_21_14_0_65_60_17]